MKAMVGIQRWIWSRGEDIGITLIRLLCGSILHEIEGGEKERGEGK